MRYYRLDYMDVTVPYGKSQAVFSTHENCQIVDTQPCGQCDAQSVLGQALASPINSPDFPEFAAKHKSLLFILCDGTRPTPTAMVLEQLYPHISNHPDVKFIIATGSHRAPTEGELNRIFGQYLEEFRPRIMAHVAKDKEAHLHLGTTKLGTPVAFDRAVFEAEGLITINSVEPHYFAGYTGGRKSFLPGVASYETIERNHSYTDRPGSAPLALEGNPVSEDMFEAAGMIDKPVFSIQTVMTADHLLYAAATGHIKDSFIAAVQKAQELYSVPIKAKANIVVTVAPPPMDSNLYQSQKALEHGRNAMEHGGIMILVSSCWDGIGDRVFYDMLVDFKDGDDLVRYTGDNYKLGNHKAARMLSLAQLCKIWAVTDLEQETLAPARITKKSDLQKAVDEACQLMRESGKQPRIIVLPSGSLIVPRLEP